MINDQWHAIEWSELLSQLDFGMKVHETNEPMKCYIIRPTLLCTQIFHFLFDCLIHHTAILLSAQQNMFPTRTSNLTGLTTESISFDNKTQAKSSKRRILTKVFHWCSSTLSCPQVDFNTKTIDNPYINNCAVCLSKTITYPLISTSLFPQLHRI